MSPTLDATDRELPAPSPEALIWWGFVLALQVSVLGAYLLATDQSIRPFYVYPFVWITVGLWAVVETSPAPAPRRRRATAGALAVGYFLVLGYVGGLFGGGVAGGYAPGLRVSTSVPPGYGPALVYGNSFLSLSITPYALVGYVALAYLVYATVIDAAGAAVTGVLGLLSCVSCSWPVLASIATGVTGGSSAIAGAFYAESYAISTVVFLATVTLLYWRPFGG